MCVHYQLVVHLYTQFVVCNSNVILITFTLGGLISGLLYNDQKRMPFRIKSYVTHNIVHKQGLQRF